MAYKMLPDPENIPADLLKAPHHRRDCILGQVVCQICRDNLWQLNQGGAIRMSNRSERDKLASWVQEYQKSGRYYRSATNVWTDVFEETGFRIDPPVELGAAGKLLTEFDGSTAQERLRKFWQEVSSQRLAFLQRSNESMAVSEVAELQDVKIMHCFAGFEQKQLDTDVEKLNRSYNIERQERERLERANQARLDALPP